MMKKVIISAILLLFLGLTGFSQTGIYNGGIGNRTLRVRGWIFRPEMGVGYSRDHLLPIVVNMGYQVTPHIYVGGGMSFSMGLESYYDSNSGTIRYGNSESLFGSVRWYCLDRRSSPFMELNIGIGRFDYPRRQYHYDDYYYYNGYYYYDEYFCYYRSVKILPYLSLDAGYNFKNFDFKVGLGDYYGYDLGIRVTVGYNFLMKK